MSKRNKALKAIKTGREAKRYLDSSPYRARHGKGDHVVYEGDNGSVVIDGGADYEYPRWVRREIIKAIIAAGLAVIVFALVYPAII